MQTEPVGIYFHIPFCDGKCPYCDFYSTAPTDSLRNEYVKSALKAVSAYKGVAADTLYFGGGTPTLLGEDGLISLLDGARKTFCVDKNAEITFEMNPRTADAGMLRGLHDAGFNRISIGVQSGVDGELALLGRRHTSRDAAHAVEISRAAGFDNLSLDLMLGIPSQTEETLRASLEFILSLSPEHVSAYILKLEPGTPFFENADRRETANDDEQAGLYELACDYLNKHGYDQYEISNFAKTGKESRHNLKYWNCSEYLGFGPSAHSFFGGKRFFYERKLDGFITGDAPVSDGDGGDPQEYAMLRLRLADGLCDKDYSGRYGSGIPEEYRLRAKKLSQSGLVICDDIGIRLTRKGFLLSNPLISKILFG